MHPPSAKKPKKEKDDETDVPPVAIVEGKHDEEDIRIGVDNWGEMMLQM
jgi:hypothetical protein